MFAIPTVVRGRLLVKERWQWHNLKILNHVSEALQRLIVKPGWDTSPLGQECLKDKAR